ncbi:MAG: transporter, family, oxalate/formate antiporter [Chloroflexota bacterium]|nr:transporter, family, oxalate/formate antiporter [Chloroflexota bacterium]
MIDRAPVPSTDTLAVERGRWWQLLIGVICMSMIANFQYGWTLFVNPLDAKYHWGRAAIQVAFTVFVLTETWLIPIEGYLVDRFGPRPVVMGGGLLCGLSWGMSSVADSLALLYIAAAIGGVGAGAVYGTCVGNALKWFPDRAGLAAGLTAAGFGAGSALTVIPISNTIASSGYEAAFLKFGIGQGAFVIALSWLLRAPDPVARPAGRATTGHAGRDYCTLEMVRTPAFWVMYLVFVMVASGGLMATAHLASIAEDFGVADTPVAILGLTLPALTFSLSIDRVLNGLTRPFFGWVSDYLGRENTMFLAFSLEALGIYALSAFGRDPVAFVLLSGLVFLAWGEIYSLFPATCRDTYGGRFAAANAGLLYTAKGTAALLVPCASVLAAMTGGWSAVFVTASVLNAVAAVTALLVLKPLRAGLRTAPAEPSIPAPALASGEAGGHRNAS